MLDDLRGTTVDDVEDEVAGIDTGGTSECREPA
jgi:hypothetical protein